MIKKIKAPKQKIDVDKLTEKETKELILKLAEKLKVKYNSSVCEKETCEEGE